MKGTTLIFGENRFESADQSFRGLCHRGSQWSLLNLSLSTTSIRARPISHVGRIGDDLEVHIFTSWWRLRLHAHAAGTRTATFLATFKTFSLSFIYC
jgi:hypothetical protein